jgi:hypothetical protein
MSTGNPNFSKGLKERRDELLKRLKENTDPNEVSKIIARFSFDYNISEKTTLDYYKLFKKAGLI